MMSMFFSATLGIVCALLLPAWYWAVPVVVIHGLNRFYRFMRSGNILKKSIVRSLNSERDGSALDPRDAFNLDTMPPDIFADKEAYSHLMLRSDSGPYDRDCRTRATGLGLITVLFGGVGIGIVAFFKMAS